MEVVADVVPREESAMEMLSIVMGELTGYVLLALLL